MHCMKTKTIWWDKAMPEAIFVKYLAVRLYIKLPQALPAAATGNANATRNRTDQTAPTVDHKICKQVQLR